MALYVVPTPLGDPDDITVRALRVLQSVQVVLAEDTRTTAALFAHHGIRAPLQAFHDHNEDARTASLIERLRKGDEIALVSDAGTPLVSDPGWPLVRAAIDAEIELHILPGACAAITALVGSGLPSHRFTFAGFVPRAPNDRKRLWDALPEGTTILYESPLRLGETLDELARRWPARAIVVARNLTKKWEQWLRGTAAEVRAALGDEERGEVVLMIGPGDGVIDVDATALIDRLLDAGESPRAIRDEVVDATGLPRREAYQRVLERISSRSQPP